MGAYITTEDAWLPPGYDLDCHRLPEREENHRFDYNELGKGSDGTEFIFGSLEHEHQAVQCPCLREVVDNGCVDIWMPKVQAPVSCFSAVESI